MNGLSSLLLDCSVQASLVCLALFALDQALRDRLSPASRHGMHVVACAAILSLPLLTLVVDRRELAWLPEEPPTAVALQRIAGDDLSGSAPLARSPGVPASVASTVPERTAVSPVSPHVPWRRLAAAAWITGTLLLLLRLVLQSRSLARVVREGRPIEAPLAAACRRAHRRLGVQPEVPVRLSPAARVPMTIGPWRPMLVLPESARTWPAGRLQSVLEHELAHVARRDVASQLVCALACAVAWHLPWVHRLARRLVRLRELACDDAVLAAGVSDVSYAEDLVAVARGLAGAKAPATAVGMGDGGALEERLRSILDPRRVRGPQHRFARWASAAWFVLAVPALAATHLEPRSGERTTRALVEHLSDPSAAVRHASLERLTDIGDPKTFQAVVRCLDDPVPAVRAACVDALTSIGCVPYFVAVTESLGDAAAEVRRAAARRLECFDDGFEGLPLALVREGRDRGEAWAALDLLFEPSDGRTALERLDAVARHDADAGVRRAARGPLEALRDD